jgi:hypothetical protein
MAECIGKSSLDPGEFLPLGSLEKSPPSESERIPIRNVNEEIQLTECIGKLS